ncbi:MAG: sterol desaturase family protein [Bacteroidota bacterium]
MFWTLLLPLVALGAVILPYLSFYKWWAPAFKDLKIHPKTAPFSIQLKAGLYTSISFGVFALCGGILDLLQGAHFTQLYTQSDSPFYLYEIMSLGIIFLIHDAYFYWSHRLLHLPWVYQHVHAWHHRFHNPSPFMAFAFHPVEAIIQIGIIPFLAILFPIHQSILVFFAVFLLLMSVYGHLGFELRANKKGVFQLFNTAIHHHQHHQYFECNYGIYFNFWDQLMKTNHKTYPEAFFAFGRQLRKKKTQDSQSS